MLEWILVGIALLLLFWDIVGLMNRWFHLEKRGFTISPGVLMWRTKRGLNFIDKTAKSNRRWWRIFGTGAVIFGFAFMIFMLVNLVLNAAFIMTRPEVATPGVRLVIPGLTIPLWEGLLAMFSVLLVHEFSHGLVLRSFDLPIKSAGAMMFVAIPGAFVEPDEKRLKKAPIMQRLRVYGAGSFANILLALLCLSILLVAVTPRPGVYVWGVSDNVAAPAHDKMRPGMRLYSISINDNATTTLNGWEDFYDIMDNVRPGDNLTILANDNVITLTAAASPENENRGYVGLTPISAIPRSSFINPIFTLAAISYGIVGYPLFHPYCDHSFLPWPIISLLTWMFMLNFAIGLFNLLPAVPLDGGYIFRSLLEKKVKRKTAEQLSNVLALFVLMLIVVNLFPMVW
jgi:membrane-associated protease RseP (regulator of RpoE activity)